MGILGGGVCGRECADMVASTLAFGHDSNCSDAISFSRLNRLVLCIRP